MIQYLMKTLRNFINLYINGFKNMTLGKTLWSIGIIKILIFIFVFKMLFFNETINTRFDTEQEKINFIYNNLIKE